jgi:flagellar assembly factor FliW
VADPWAFFADYALDVPDGDAERLGIGDPAQARVLVVIRVGPTAEECFANLKAPILVVDGRGHQVLNEGDAQLRAPLVGTADPCCS